MFLRLSVEVRLQPDVRRPSLLIELGGFFIIGHNGFSSFLIGITPVSITKTKDQLKAIVENRDNKVVALSGAWGTGKSHLWKDIQIASSCDEVRDALYASLFGVSDLATLKVKLAEQVLSKKENIGRVGDLLKHMSKLRPFMKRLVSNYDAWEEMALLASPVILKNRFIVIDDIERKGASLSIDHILGFIDEYVQQHGARFLIIMNTDQLKDSEVWETLREKVVDYEVRLKTTPEEAFEVANSLCASKYRELVGEAVKACNVVNIRIVNKIVRAINLIFDGHEGLPDDILCRMIPSTVLIAATHYKGIKDGPTMEFVLSPPKLNLYVNSPHKTTHIETSEDKQKVKWRALMDAIGVIRPDKYEELVADFFSSGLFDRSHLDAILARYRLDEEKARFDSDLIKFYEKASWDVLATDASLIQEAESLCSRISFASARVATGLCEELSMLDGGEDISERVISGWIDAKKDDLSELVDGNHFDEKVHPRIVEYAKRAVAEDERAFGIVDACLSMQKNSGYSARHENALNFRGVEDYECFIRNATPEERKVVFYQFRQMYLNRPGAYLGFSPAITAFFEACQKIASEPPSRLQKIVIRLMRQTGIPIENETLVGEEVSLG